MMTNSVSLPSNRFTLSDGFRTCINGKLYVGLAGTDATVIANQISVFYLDSTGTEQGLTQPIQLDAIGRPTDGNGNFIDLYVKNNYSIAVMDAYGVLQLNVKDIPIYTAGSFAELRKIVPLYAGQTITLKGWNSGSTLGGGEFVAVMSNGTDDGGNIATTSATSGYYWRRLNNDFNTPYDFGLLCDGSTDEGLKLNNLITLFKSLNKKVYLDFLNNTLISSITLNIDLDFIGIKNAVFSFPSPTLDDSGNFFGISLDGTSPKSRNNNLCWEKITTIGPESRSSKNYFGYLLKPSGDLSSLNLIDISISNWRSAVVFGTNSYLLTFTRPFFKSCHNHLTDTVAIGVETAITNAGENFTFIHPKFTNSNSIMYIVNIEAGWRMFGPSFDYCGGPLTSSYKQFYISKNGTVIDLFGPHFEAGNSNDGFTDDIFYFDDTSVHLNIVGGEMSIGNTTYNNVPYFVNDTSGKSSIILDGTFAYATGINQWINDESQYTRFNPSINYDNSNTPGTIGGISPFILDPTFTNTNGFVDNWYVAETQTSQTVSDTISAAYSTTTDNSGNTIPCLRLTRIKGSSGSNAKIYLIIKKPKNNFKPSWTINMKAESSITITDPMFIESGLCNYLGFTGSFYRPNVVDFLSTSVIKISDIPTTITEFKTNKNFSYSSGIMTYDYMLIGININSFPANASIVITSVDVSCPF